LLTITSCRIHRAVTVPPVQPTHGPPLRNPDLPSPSPPNRAFRKANCRLRPAIHTAPLSEPIIHRLSQVWEVDKPLQTVLVLISGRLSPQLSSYRYRYLAKSSTSNPQPTLASSFFSHPNYLSTQTPHSCSTSVIMQRTSSNVFGGLLVLLLAVFTCVLITPTSALQVQYCSKQNTASGESCKF